MSQEPPTEETTTNDESTEVPRSPRSAGLGIDYKYPRLVLLALLVTVGIGLLAAGTTSTAAFGAYNPAWDGTADLRGIAAETANETTIIRETNRFEDIEANGTVAIVVSPAQPYTDSAAQQLRSFVERGGTIVLAEDFGPYTNPLLADIGATARLNGSVIRDEQSHYRGPALPIATNVTQVPLTDGVEQLTLNYGTAIDPGNATAIVRTSDVAYLDANQDETLNDNESIGPFDVVTTEPIADGRVIVVGDPSLFINAMLERSGNRAFARSLLDARQVVFDYSHAGGIPPLVALQLTISQSAWLQVGLGTAVIFGLGLGLQQPTLGARVKGHLDQTPRRTDATRSPEEVIEAVARQHPHWEKERLRKIMRGIITSENKSGKDD